MRVRIVVTLIGESKSDAMQMPVILPQVQEQYKSLIAQGLAGPPDNTEIHYLVKPGVWDRG